MFPSIFYTISIDGEKIFKIKKDFAASQLAIITACRWTGNKLFLKGGLLLNGLFNKLLKYEVHDQNNYDMVASKRTKP